MAQRPTRSCGRWREPASSRELEGAEGEIGGAPHDGPCRVLVESELVGAAQAALLDEAARQSL